jgi:hypothetical protein
MKKTKLFISLFLISLLTLQSYAHSLIPFKNGKYYGFVNENMEIVQQPVYRYIQYSNDGSYICTDEYTDTEKAVSIFNKNGKLVWKSPDPEQIVPIYGQYFFSQPLDSDRARDSELIDAAKGTVTKLIDFFDICRIDFTEQIPDPPFAVRLSDSYKYFGKDLKKEYLSEKTFQCAFPMVDGAAAVIIGNHEYSLINKEGAVILDHIYNCANNFCEGLMPVQMYDKRSGFVNNKGKFVFECPIYDNSRKFSPGPDPSLYYVFSEGYAYVPVSETAWNIYSKEGKIVAGNLSAVPANWAVFSEGKMAVYKTDGTGKEIYGYIDTRGNTAVPFIFDGTGYYNTGSFHDGYAIVMYKGRDALLDEDGNLYFSDDLIAENRKSAVNIHFSE